MNESKRQISASTDMLSMPQGHHSHKENEPMEDEFLEEEGRLWIENVWVPKEKHNTVALKIKIRLGRSEMERCI